MNMKYKIWKTITIGKKPKTGGINMSNFAESMLKKVKWNKYETIDLVLLTPKDFGFNGWITTKKLFAKAKQEGLSLCPPQVGLQLRVDYKKQPLNEWIYIAMKPIAGSGGDPRVFGVGRGGDGLWLLDTWANPDYRWDPSGQFALGLKNKTSLKEKVLENTKVNGDCWEWQGALAHGYGRIKNGETTLAVHRIIYEALIGIIPSGLVLDHLCRNRKCVNPTHLELVSIGENVLRGIGISAMNAKKTHCIKGHEFTEDNIYSKRGKRECRQCKKESRK